MAAAEPTPTRILAEHALTLDAAALPAAVLEQAVIVLADSVGVLLLASLGRAEDLALRTFPLASGPCTVVGHGRGAAPDVAAFVNACGAHGTELDDTHSPSLTHPSSVLVPAALAAAELAGACTGATLLAAVVAGYDVQARISKAMGPQAQFDRGFHPTSVCGAIGAAVCAGRVLGLTTDHLVSAIGLAASQSSGLVTFRSDESSLQKAFQAGVAARNGVFAAMLARDGYLAAPNVLTDTFDALTPFGGPDVDPSQLLADLTTRFEIMSTSIKRHPSCGRSHAPIDALLSLLSEHAIRADDIEEIRVEVAHSAAPTIDRRPQLTHNIQHLLAVVALEGDLQRQHVEREWAGRPDVVALASRVRLSGSDALERVFPAQKGAVVTVRTAQGIHSRTLLGPKGSPDHPLATGDLRAKFRSLAGEVLDPETADSLWTTLTNIAELESITPLMVVIGRRRQLSEVP